jgi:hypothetical protein
MSLLMAAGGLNAVLAVLMDMEVPFLVSGMPGR